MSASLPLPPPELRALVGDPAIELWENPTGEPILSGLPSEAWRSYLDFGCGCGRSARRLLVQHPRPERYLGVDLNQEMIDWCDEHLEPVADGFSFVHHDVFNIALNPRPQAPLAAALPAEAGAFTLVEAHSVFTHLTEAQAEYYLDEIERVLAPDGWFVATWFLFEPDGFPYMPPGRNALYVHVVDPTYAVAFERPWLAEALARRGLVVARAEPPAVRGYHWRIFATRAREGIVAVDLPEDLAPVGDVPRPAVGESWQQLLAAQEAQLGPARELAFATERIAVLEHELAEARSAASVPLPGARLASAARVQAARLAGRLRA